MSCVWECTNERCQKITFGEYDGNSWHPVKAHACGCDAPFVPLTVCDYCGGKVYSKWDEEAGDWKTPNEMWRTFPLDNWEIASCGPECHEEVMMRATSEKSHTTTSTVILRPTNETPSSGFSVEGHDSIREDDRTPSDAFALP